MSNDDAVKKDIADCAEEFLARVDPKPGYTIRQLCELVGTLFEYWYRTGLREGQLSSTDDETDDLRVGVQTLLDDLRHAYPNAIAFSTERTVIERLESLL